MHVTDLPKSPPARGEDAMHSSTENCEDDRRESKQEQAAHLTATLKLLRIGGSFVSFFLVRDVLRAFKEPWHRGYSGSGML